MRMRITPQHRAEAGKVFMASDSLVGHRVKECCVRLHSCVKKWQQLSSQGLDAASKLVQTAMQKK